LLQGSLTADDYEDARAKDPRIDKLREKITVTEDKRFTREYLEADKRSIASSLQVFFKDGSHTEKLTIEYPIGHKRRRDEGIPVLFEKFHRNLLTAYSDSHSHQIMQLMHDQQKLTAM